jgi:glutamate--cysteine ligase
LQRALCAVGVILTLSLQDYLSAFQEKPYLDTLKGIGRGIEREALRVLPNGALSQKPHAFELGSALTHPQITTDYAENLLEFITPVTHSPEEAIEQLRDIQKFTLSKIGDELLWPLSMPCFVEDEEQIPLANYGTSNIGKMKHVYRKGLKNRYGSMMQVIAGIHFNFSFPISFWSSLQKITKNQDELTDFISDRYFAVLRNYKRYCWLIPYLFGSSPLICNSFLQKKPNKYSFKKTPSGYLYLPHATSLRMSDLGYTSSSQAQLHICYNGLENYVNDVKKAMHLPSKEFAKIGVKVNGEYRQLNSNILQIENELYSSIRPKRVTKTGEKPSDALKNRGVEYIEVRALDVNPFSDTGISVEQVYFLDVFLTFCALSPNEHLDEKVQKIYDNNMTDVILRGRDPNLLLNDQGEQKLLSTWGQELFADLHKVAEILDLAYQTNNYTAAVARELTKIINPEQTPSAQLLNLALSSEQSLTQITLSLAQTYKTKLLARDYRYFDERYFQILAHKSHQKQQAIEAADKVDFDSFLADYFSEK